ncbi:MAG: P63C domain-containing protein [Agriterribacter sp.]
MKEHKEIVEGKAQPTSKTKRPIEISTEAVEERRLLTAFLLDKKEELIRERAERQKKIETERIELRNGKTISRLEIIQFVTALIQSYPSVFPNDNPFFKNMFRLHPKLMGLDYTNYKKPRLAGKLLKFLTYDRFGIEVLPALVVFAMVDGFWITKCYRHLTEDGIKKFIQFRDQANEMMNGYKDGEWYEFSLAFSEKYRRQTHLF